MVPHAATATTATILLLPMKLRSPATGWRSYGRRCMKRAWSVSRCAARVAPFAISMNAPTAAKNIPEQGAIRRRYHVVAVTNATILALNCCYRRCLANASRPALPVTHATSQAEIASGECGCVTRYDRKKHRRSFPLLASAWPPDAQGNADMRLPADRPGRRCGWEEIAP